MPGLPGGLQALQPHMPPHLQDMEGMARGTQDSQTQNNGGGRIPKRQTQRSMRENDKKGAALVKGKHWICCVRNFPECLCVTCAKDNQGEAEEPCCDKHGIFCAPCAKCEDYEKEGRADV